MRDKANTLSSFSLSLSLSLSPLSPSLPLSVDKSKSNEYKIQTWVQTFTLSIDENAEHDKETRNAREKKWDTHNTSFFACKQHQIPVIVNQTTQKRKLIENSFVKGLGTMSCMASYYLIQTV